LDLPLPPLEVALAAADPRNPFSQMLDFFASRGIGRAVITPSVLLHMASAYCRDAPSMIADAEAKYGESIGQRVVGPERLRVLLEQYDVPGQYRELALASEAYAQAKLKLEQEAAVWRHRLQQQIDQESLIQSRQGLKAIDKQANPSQPAPSNPAASKPAADKQALNKQAAIKPAASKPAPSKPAASKAASTSHYQPPVAAAAASSDASANENSSGNGNNNGNNNNNNNNNNGSSDSNGNNNNNGNNWHHGWHLYSVEAFKRAGLDPALKTQTKAHLMALFRQVKAGALRVADPLATQPFPELRLATAGAGAGAGSGSGAGSGPGAAVRNVPKPQA
jgi:hypothetical protein